MTDYLYLGIDPGASGGFAILHDSGALVDANPMLETERDIVDYLSEFAARIKFAHIEHVNAFPGQGVVSSFTFGKSYGGLLMALVCLKIPFSPISPRHWQALLSIPALPKRKEKRGTHAKKLITKRKAQELFPDHKWTHATADAVLLAECARRVYSGLRLPRGDAA